MTVEYILLMTLFVLFLAGSIIHGPFDAFDNGGPKLGARIEHHLMTGDGFKSKGGAAQQWDAPAQ
jgi:hypothetical protein